MDKTKNKMKIKTRQGSLTLCELKLHVLIFDLIVFDCTHQFFHCNKGKSLESFVGKINMISITQNKMHIMPYKKILVSRPSAHHFGRVHQQNLIFHFVEFDLCSTTINCCSVKADPFCPLF